MVRYHLAPLCAVLLLCAFSSSRAENISSNLADPLKIAPPIADTPDLSDEATNSFGVMRSETVLVVPLEMFPKIAVQPIVLHVPPTFMGLHDELRTSLAPTLGPREVFFQNSTGLTFTSNGMPPQLSLPALGPAGIMAPKLSDPLGEMPSQENLPAVLAPQFR